MQAKKQVLLKTRRMISSLVRYCRNLHHETKPLPKDWRQAQIDELEDNIQLPLDDEDDLVNGFLIAISKYLQTKGQKKCKP